MQMSPTRTTSPLFVLLFLLTSSAIAADEEEPGTGYWSIQLENDVFARSGDRYYTHGTQVSYLSRVSPDHWFLDIASANPLYQRGEVVNAVNHTVGQKIFTPDDTEATSVVEDDRPYAGYLYYTISALSRIARSEHFDHGNMFGFTVGMIGPSAMAEQMQRSYHDFTAIDTPAGWDNQLHDELALGFSYSRIWSIVLPVTQYFEFGVSPHITGVVGNVYTYAAGGVMFRFGTHLRGDLSPPNISPGFPGVSFFDLNEKYNWYLFAGHESRVVARNIFLDGNTFGDSHSVEKELLVGDYQFGVAVHVDKLRLAISNMIRTKEFTTQKDTTQYGAVNISFAF